MLKSNPYCFIHLFIFSALFIPVCAYSESTPTSEQAAENKNNSGAQLKPSKLSLQTGGFFRAIEVEASTTHWAFQPISFKESDENNDWSRVTTEEKYTIDPLHFYGFRTTFRTRLIDINLQYQTNEGLNVQAGDSSYLDLLLVLTGIPHLQRFSLYFQTLDFKTGRAELRDRNSNLLLDSATFRVLVDIIEARYQTKQLRFFARYMDYTLPRNVYLEHRVGEDDDAFYTYYPISDQLMTVSHQFAMVGAAIDNRKRTEVDKMLYEQPDRRNFIFGGLLGVGGGLYEMRDLRDNGPIDEGHLLAVSLQLKLGYQLRFWDTLVVGLQNELALLLLKPLGLPDKLDQFAEDEGIDTEGLSLDFGVVDFLNRFTAFARLEF